MKIILIEDDPDCFGTFPLLLEARGHQIETYVDADSVVKDLDKIAKADVVILDLMIQLGTIIKASEAVETGIAIFNRLRKVNSALKVVVITARSRADVWRYFESSKNVAFLEKPISDTELFYSTIENRI